MSFLNKIRSPKGDGPERAQAPNFEDVEIQQVANARTAEKTDTAVDANVEKDPKDEIETPTHDAQLGVQKIEAITLAWTKKSLAALLIMYVSCLRSRCLLCVPDDISSHCSPAGSGFYSSPMDFDSQSFGV